MDQSTRTATLEPVARAYEVLCHGFESIKFRADTELDCFAVALLTRVLERTEAAIHLIRVGADHSLPELVRSILEAHALSMCISAAKTEPSSNLLLQLKFVANKQAISTLELQISNQRLCATIAEKMRLRLDERRKAQEKLKASGIGELQIMERVKQISKMVSRHDGNDKPTTRFELLYKLLCDSAHHNLSSLESIYFYDESDTRNFVGFSPLSDSLYLMCLEEMLLAIQHVSNNFAACVKPDCEIGWSEIIAKINIEVDKFSTVVKPIDAGFAMNDCN